MQQSHASRCLASRCLCIVATDSGRRHEPRTALQQLVSLPPSRCSVTYRPAGLDTAVLLLRNCDWSRQFVDEVLSYRKKEVRPLDASFILYVCKDGHGGSSHVCASTGTAQLQQIVCAL